MEEENGVIEDQCSNIIEIVDVDNTENENNTTLIDPSQFDIICKSMNFYLIDVQIMNYQIEKRLI
jgi:hypothetical protein